MHELEGAPPKERSKSAELDFRRIFESAPDLYLVLDRHLVIVAVSDAYLTATLTRRASVISRGLFEVFPDNPDDPTADGVNNLRASLQRVLTEGRADTMAVQKYDIRRPESEGGGFEVRYWSPRNQPVLGPDGEVQYIIHRVEDVTEFVNLKQQGSELDRQNAELQQRTVHMEGEIYARAQEIQQANNELRSLQEGLESRVRERTMQLERAHEQLRQSQKLEAVGRLAGGIAHDFNNLLSVILSYTTMLLEDGGVESNVRDDLQQVHQAGERAAELTRQLLAFSRQQVLDLQIVDLNSVITNVSKMLIRLVGERVELKTSLAHHLFRVLADRGQIEQVIMNLVVNACDAMPRGGKLTIETSNVELDENYAKGHLGVTPGPYVLMAVSDTGTGMDAATQARIFEPFFTTKERGKGTGLGLSTVLGIVQQSKGSVWVYSEPGKGTTFKVFLPRAQGTVKAALLGTTDMPAARGLETILVVEDEEQVRRVAVGILSRAGYRVLEANGPRAAIELARDRSLHIDLLLSDVVMPDMGGPELAAALKEVRPGLKTLFMSGYTDDAIIDLGVLNPDVSFIQKPITPATLTRKVRDVLER